VSESKPKIIVVTGPECSGKTTLARQLAEKLGEPWVPEYAREYLGNVNRPYVQEDLFEIAKGQMFAISKAELKAENWLVADTGPEVIQIWHRDKFGPEPEELLQIAAAFEPALYLLCKPDIPYVPDLLREDPFRRDELFERYVELLRSTNVQVMSGGAEKRLVDAMRVIST
jgi:nicotinamide riboside kinase